MKIVIAGGGVAAFEAAVAARKSAPESEITVLSREAVPPYRRPALSGMVAQDLDDARFLLKSAEFFASERIELKLGVEVLALDPAKRTLTCADGETRSFDRLVIATGAGAFVPPVPGLAGDKVAVLREYADLQRFRARLDAGIKKATVLGGGVLGLELAASLLARGVAVTVVENFPGIMPRNLDPEAGKLVFDKLSAVPNLTLKFGVSALEASDGALKLSDGTTVESDLICVSAGVRANTRLALDAGLPCNRGIVVDDRLRVLGFEGIYAAGDVAEFAGRGCGLFGTAKKMGNIAGVNAAGGDAVYAPENVPVRAVLFGMKIFSAGSIADLRGEGGGTVENYRKLFYDASGVLRGAVLLGDLSQALKLQSEIVS